MVLDGWPPHTSPGSVSMFVPIVFSVTFIRDAVLGARESSGVQPESILYHVR